MTPQHVTVDMKATNQRFYVVLFIMMYIAFFTLSPCMKTQWVGIHDK